MRNIYSIASADFMERTRRYSFWAIMALTVLFGVFFIPSSGATFGVMDFNGYRGVYNSAWIGTSVACVTSIMIFLIGFYLVKNSNTRDEISGVGEIIASKQVTKLQYCIGKAFSKFILLSIMMFIIILVSGIMQLVRAEDTNIVIVDLVLPFLLITWPTILVVSSLAVFFESVTRLRNSLGNVIYFFIWLGTTTATTNGVKYFDITGGAIVLQQIMNDISRAFSNYKSGFAILGTINTKHTFIWEGIKWTSGALLNRLICILIGCLIVYLASIVTDRFSVGSNIKRKVLK